MAAVEALDRGSSKAGPAGGCPGVCGACPMARLCRPQAINSGEARVVVNGIGELLQKKELPRGMIYFNPKGQESSGPQIRPSEKKCTVCDESSCSHLAA